MRPDGEFTLLEMLVVIAIFGLLSLAAVLAYPKLTQRAEIHQIAAKLDALLLRAHAEARRRGEPLAVRFSPAQRLVSAPALGLAFKLPNDASLTFEGIADGNVQKNLGAALVFLADGSSTGAKISVRVELVRVRQTGVLANGADRCVSMTTAFRSSRLWWRSPFSRAPFPL